MSKTILDLCGGTGSWSKPYKENGYNVIILTLPKNDVTRIIFEEKRMICPTLNLDVYDELFIKYDEVYGILAAPPCTEWSLLNCVAAPRDRDEKVGMITVDACLDIINKCNPEFWALENPVGHLRKYMPTPKLTFQPWWYGDPWTKRTDIWGNFNIPTPKYNNWDDVPKLNLYTRPSRDKPNFAFLHKSAQKDIPQLKNFEVKTDADFRAITPPGFAYAFFEANK